jgi:VanZ family protein
MKPISRTAACMAPDSLKKFALSWGPAILMLGLIFLFSSIPNKSQLPNVEPLKLNWQTVPRKSGHLLEYGLLALGMQRGLRLRGWKGIAITIICVLFYALSDEFHQSFVPGRTDSLIDVGIDLLGAVLGIWVGTRLRSVWVFLTC